MLIQITNQCDNGCPHCLHNSVINGGHMTLETFNKALEWIDRLQVNTVIISGGEPFMHPDLYKMCSKLKCNFIVASNGNFIKNYFLKKKAVAISNLPNCVGIQVTSVSGLYPNYLDILTYKDELKRIPGVIPCLDIEIYIKDLGRARNKYPVNPTYPGASCVNTHLVARQSTSLHKMILLLEQYGHFCIPLIDYQGNIHCSESWLCPSYGSLDTPIEEVYNNIKKASPCGKCANWKAMQGMSKYSKVLEILK